MPEFFSGFSGGGGQAAPITSQGIPQEGIAPSGAVDQQALTEILQMLRGGQVGAERFMELLSMLAGSTLPQMGSTPEQAGPDEGPSGPGDIDLAAMLGG